MLFRRSREVWYTVMNTYSSHSPHNLTYLIRLTSVSNEQPQWGELYSGTSDLSQQASTEHRTN